MFKRFAALFLVVLMSIESMAAVVSDNDGAAFITKAEFDSLKNTFQGQIDSYNKNIDNKIEGAINSYLAGVKASKESRLDGNIDCLSYPLRLVNYHKGLYRLDSPRRERSIHQVIFSMEGFIVRETLGPQHRVMVC